MGATKDSHRGCLACSDEDPLPRGFIGGLHLPHLQCQQEQSQVDYRLRSSVSYTVQKIVEWLQGKETVNVFSAQYARRALEAALDCVAYGDSSTIDNGVSFIVLPLANSHCTGLDRFNLPGAGTSSFLISIKQMVSSSYSSSPVFTLFDMQRYSRHQLNIRDGNPRDDQTQNAR